MALFESPLSPFTYTTLPFSFHTPFQIKSTNPELEFHSVALDQLRYGSEGSRVEPLKSTNGLSSTPSPSGPIDTNVMTMFDPPPEVPGHLDRYLALRARLEQEIEGLQDARDDLIGFRYRLSKQRREYKDFRHEAEKSATEAEDALQAFLVQEGIVLPHDIQEKLSTAKELGKHVAELGAGLDEAEEKYDLEEWQYTVKEKKFVEHLPGEELTPHNPLLIQSPQQASPTNFSSPAFSDAQLCFDQQGFVSSSQCSYDSGHLFDPAKDLVDQNGSDEKPPMTTNHLSTPRAIELLSREPETYESGLDGSTLSHHNMDDHSASAKALWSNTRIRINEWRIDVLSKSEFEQILLKQLVPQKGMSDAEWFQLIRQISDSNSPQDDAFHTGDTIISSGDISQLIAIPDTHHSPVSRTLEIVNHNQLSLDHWGVNGPNLNPPHPYEPLMSSRNEAFSTEERLRASYSVHKCIHPQNSDLDSDGHRGDLHDSNLLTMLSDGHLNIQSALDLNRTEHQHRVHLETPMENQRPLSLGDTLEPKELATSLYTIYSPRPSLVTKEDDQSVTAMHPVQDSIVTDARFSEPYIRIESPEPWALPLLRLTPLADIFESGHRHNLEDVPFVFTSKAPYRLPGPF